MHILHVHIHIIYYVLRIMYIAHNIHILILNIHINNILYVYFIIHVYILPPTQSVLLFRKLSVDVTT